MTQIHNNSLILQTLIQVLNIIYQSKISFQEVMIRHCVRSWNLSVLFLSKGSTFFPLDTILGRSCLRNQGRVICTVSLLMFPKFKDWYFFKQFAMLYRQYKVSVIVLRMVPTLFRIPCGVTSATRAGKRRWSLTSSSARPSSPSPSFSWGPDPYSVLTSTCKLTG